MIREQPTRNINHGHLPEPRTNRKYRTFYVPSLNAMTPQQRVFAEEYMIDLDPKQAAIRAGYPVDKAGYAATTIMKHPPVRDHIAKLMAARSRRVGLTADRVLQRLGAIVMGDPRAIFNEDGGLRKPGDMNADDALMLAGVKTRRTITQTVDDQGKMAMVPEEITEIKVVDGLAALSLAMRHLGMMNDKLDINVTHALADRLNAAHKRVAGRNKSCDVQTIDGEFVEDVSEALAALEHESTALNQQLAALPEPPAFNLADFL